VLDGRGIGKTGAWSGFCLSAEVAVGILCFRAGKGCYKRDGTTRIKTAELDEAGRFGDWPEDFDEVALEAENRYLSAAENRLAKG
jgi:hypothetical protein